MTFLALNRQEASIAVERAWSLMQDRECGPRTTHPTSPSA
jgi:hypothetical protein